MEIGTGVLASFVIVISLFHPPTDGPPASKGDYIAMADLNAHLPIEIDGDDEFTPENGVRRGAGTIHDPHVISGWRIEAPGIEPLTHAIRITNTSAHVEIRGNSLSALLSGEPRHSALLLERTTNVTVLENEFSYSEVALAVEGSPGTRILKNKARGLAQTGFVFTAGILVRDSSGANVTGNELVDLWTGVMILGNSVGVVVSENRLLGGRFDAIVVHEGADDALVADNLIVNSGGSAIDIQANRATVLANRIVGAAGDGVLVYNSGQVPRGGDIRNNVVSDGYGGLFVQCEVCQVSQNEVARTEGSGTFHGNVTVTHNEFDAVINRIQASGNVTLHDNNIFVSEATDIQADAPVDARNNYWGTASGPGGVEGTVAVDPWLTEPVPGAGLSAAPPGTDSPSNGSAAAQDPQTGADEEDAKGVSGLLTLLALLLAFTRRARWRS